MLSHGFDQALGGRYQNQGTLRSVQDLERDSADPQAGESSQPFRTGHEHVDILLAFAAGQLESLVAVETRARNPVSVRRPTASTPRPTPVRFGQT